VADFCRNCFPEFADFEGLTTKESWEKGLAACVLCEGCGAIQVDPDGFCLGDCEPYFHPDTPHACRHCALVQTLGGTTRDQNRRCHFHGGANG
jgi:hypothetical protein